MDWCSCYNISLFLIVFVLSWGFTTCFPCFGRARCLVHTAGSSRWAFGGKWSRPVPLERRGAEHRLSVLLIACSWCFGVLWARLVSQLVCFVGGACVFI